MSRPIIFWLSVLLLFSGAAVVWSAINLVRLSETHSGAESVVDTESDAPSGEKIQDFTLIERSGKEFNSADLKGQVWVASFFFSSCPGSCRAQNFEVMALQNKFAKKGVKFISITCDPKTDTTDKLRMYAETFHADPDSWLFLTGDLKYIIRIGKEKFLVPVSEQGHSERLMVVDKWSNVRGYFDWKNPANMEKMRTMLDELLAEQSPPAEINPSTPEPPAAAPAHSAEDLEAAESDEATTEASSDETAAEPAAESAN